MWGMVGLHLVGLVGGMCGRGAGAAAGRPTGGRHGGGDGLRGPAREGECCRAKAGQAITRAAEAWYLFRPVRAETCMGVLQVLSVDGVREKARAARDEGVDRFIAPFSTLRVSGLTESLSAAC